MESCTMTETINRLERALRQIRSEESRNYFYYYPVVMDGCLPNGPFDFTDVRISLELFNDEIREAGLPYLHLEGFMKKGLSILDNFVKKGENHSTLDSLLSFMQESGEHGLWLQNLKEQKDVGDKSAVGLAVHLFSKLYAKGDFVLDSRMFLKNDKYQCFCGCEMSVESNVAEQEEECASYACVTDKTDRTLKSTGLGHPEVWHGRTDIILKSEFAVPTTVITTEELARRLGHTSFGEEESDSSDSEYHIPTEVKQRVKMALVLNHDYVTAQLISTTIVGSFANASRHTDKGVQMIYPALGCTLDHVSVYYYDCEHDLLITRGALINIWFHDKISDAAIVELWLMLNFQPELPAAVLKKFPKSEFQQTCRGWALNCYKLAKIGEPVPMKKNKHGKKYSRQMLAEATVNYQTFLNCELD